MIPQECVRETNDSRITLKDQRSVAAIFLNPERARFRQIQLDGCVLKNRVACDWILEKSEIGRIVVELKGGDVRHALLQVEAGLDYLKTSGLTPLKAAALIVCTKYHTHPSFNTAIQRAKSKLAKTHKAHLHITKNARDLNFESLLNSSSEA